MKKPKLLLIDSSALIYRAFYALPPLTDKQGRVVNAVYGFMSAFLNILKQTGPTHIIFAFDSPKPTHRKEKYVEYKAQREKAPDDLYAQIPISKELVQSFNFIELETPGFEADDIIATCAKEFIKKTPEGEVVIATGDLDTLQLINPKTKVLALSRGISEAKLYDEKAVQERFGLEPHQMIDFKSLFGDASDNIKGVKGIGQKTAADLLQKYHTLEGIYQNLVQLTPRLKDLLAAEKDQAFLSKELVTLHTDLPLGLKWKEAAYTNEKLDSGKVFLSDLSFNSLVKRIEKITNNTTTDNNLVIPSGAERSRGIPFKKEGSLGVARDDKKNNINISQISNADELFKLLENIDHLIFWSGNTEKGDCLAIASLNKNQISKIFLMPVEIAQRLDISIFKDKNIFLFDLKENCKNIFPLKLPAEKLSDLKIKAYLIQPPLMRKFGFKEIVWHFLKERFEEPKKQMSLLGAEEKGRNLEKVTEIMGILTRLAPEVEETFAKQVKFQEESKFISVVYPQVKNKVQERSIDFVYRQIEKPLGGVLSQMEMAGIKIDLELLKKLGAKNAHDIDKLKEKIFQLAGKEFNLDSPSQLADVLFRDLAITTENSKIGKAGHFSTAAGVLEKLEKAHPVVSFLLDYREQRKFQTTYLEVIPDLVDKNTNRPAEGEARLTGRLHTSFDQTGAATGRLSSNNPNLQNIPLQPIEGNIGIRHAFISAEGYSLISLDYSQIEIRLAAYLSGEEKLMKAFERGKDIHRETAAFVNKIDPDKVDDDMRNAAKALNFGIMYGMSPFGFAQSSKLPEAQARDFIQNYFREFPRISEYINKTKEFAREFGYVETIFGRRRYVPEVNFDNRILRQAGERMAINMPLQGTAADIMKLALVEVSKFLEEKYADPKTHPLEREVRILLSIHDEIILEVQNNLVEKVAGETREIMENVAKNIIPLKVDVEIGKNWGEI
ncbi:MAG: DNA polymerase I [Candidatus Moraniibacteriota bacterium]